MKSKVTTKRVAYFKDLKRGQYFKFFDCDCEYSFIHTYEGPMQLKSFEVMVIQRCSEHYGNRLIEIMHNCAMTKVYLM